jgi:DNA ligase-1
MVFKPLLAPRESPSDKTDFFEKLPYPLMVSPKFDGIRCIVTNTGCMSRTMKLLPSTQVQDKFKKFLSFDGELIVGNPSDPDVYNRTQSHVMSVNKPTLNLKFFAFDIADPDLCPVPYVDRLQVLEGWVKEYDRPDVVFVRHQLVHNHDDLIKYETECLIQGYEGIMMRTPAGIYKQGRATFNEQIIYKLKRYEDAEGQIIDILPMMANTNTQERDELGYAKRSSAKAGLEATDLAGMFYVAYKGDVIKVAPGMFNHLQRKWIMYNADRLIDQGRYLKFRFFGYGIKDKPRFPRALGFRDEMDMEL